MNQEDIKEIIPHRENMLLVEEADIKDGTVYGKYKIKGDEFFLKGHFPGNPVVPGVIQCEMLAQTAGLLIKDYLTEGKVPFFAALNNVRFKNPVKPGDVLESKCVITKAKPPFFFAQGEGYVDGKLCVKAEFSVAVMEKK